MSAETEKQPTLPVNIASLLAVAGPAVFGAHAALQDGGMTVEDAIDIAAAAAKNAAREAGVLHKVIAVNTPREN